MDPESGLDDIRNVGISGGKIRVISAESLTAKQTIEARGLVVAPGFIDLHEHGQEPRNYQFQAHDGVTTSLELELGTDDVAKWYAAREGHSLINYGVSAGHIPMRIHVMTGQDVPSLNAAHTPAAEAANHREVTAEELGKLRAAIENGFHQGALAEGMGINYTPGASHWEILEMFRLAAKYHAPLQVHLRYASLLEPETGIAALEEVVAAAAATGARLHVAHITSMGLKYTPQLIEVIAGARQRGLDVTTECYPYTAASTNLNSAVFDNGWQERMDITYKDLQWAETGERLTPETFARYRQPCNSGGSGAGSGGEPECHDRERRIADYRTEHSSTRTGDVLACTGAFRARRKGLGSDDSLAKNDSYAGADAGATSPRVQGQRTDSRGSRCRHYCFRPESHN
jgi:N-acyl-D-aspartate/D-glutamate deacylase